MSIASLPEARIWHAFFIRMIDDALEHDLITTQPVERSCITRHARKWFVRGDSPEFHIACAAAGLDPETVHQWAQTQDMFGWLAPQALTVRRGSAGDALQGHKRPKPTSSRQTAQTALRAA